MTRTIENDDTSKVRLKSLLLFLFMEWSHRGMTDVSVYALHRHAIPAYLAALHLSDVQFFPEELVKDGRQYPVLTVVITKLIDHQVLFYSKDSTKWLGINRVRNCGLRPMDSDKEGVGAAAEVARIAYVKNVKSQLCMKDGKEF